MGALPEGWDRRVTELGNNSYYFSLRESCLVPGLLHTLAFEEYFITRNWFGRLTFFAYILIASRHFNHQQLANLLVYARTGVRLASLVRIFARLIALKHFFGLWHFTWDIPTIPYLCCTGSSVRVQCCSPVTQFAPVRRVRDPWPWCSSLRCFLCKFIIQPRTLQTYCHRISDSKRDLIKTFASKFHT